MQAGACAALLGGTALIAPLAAILMSQPALAACSSTNPADGSTVTCTGAETARVGNGGQLSVTVNVQSGATLTRGNFTQAVSLDSLNIINNAGTIDVGVGSTGIKLLDSNTINNTGTINSGGGNSFGINAGDSNTIRNSGTMRSADLGSAILATDLNTIINTGTIIIGSNAGSFVATDGINARDSNTVINSGTITGGSGTGGGQPLYRVHGIVAGSGNAQIENRGTITVGNVADGISVGDSNSVVNYGTITAGNGDGTDRASGILLANSNTLIENRGTINVGNLADGISISGTNNTSVTNYGVINAAGGYGMATQSTSSGNILINAGTIAATNGGAGIFFDGDNNSITNNGTIRATGTGASILFCVCATNSTATNNGTLDGVITLTGSGHTFNNNGLVTITDGATSVGQNHQVIGAFNQSSTGVFALRANSTGTIDNITVSSATLGGTLRAVLQPSLYGSQTTYANVLTSSAAITTKFSSIVASSAFFTITPIYDTNNSSSYTALSLRLTRIGFGSIPGSTQNQRAVGSGLESAYSTALTGNAATFYTNLFAATSPTSALQQLSGQGVSASQNAALGAGSQFGSTMFSQGLNGETNANTLVFDPAPLQYAPTQKSRGHEAFAALPTKAPQVADVPGRWRIWTAGFGSDSRWSGDAAAGIASQKSRTYGGVIGVDHQVTRDLLVGVAAGGSETNFSAPDLATSGRTTGGHVGIYAVKTWNAFYAAASLSYARFDNSTTRTITGVGPTETAAGGFGSDHVGGRVEFGWKQAYRGFIVTPFVAVEPSAVRQRGFTETSVQTGGTPGLLGLTFNSRTTTSLPTFVGAQFDTRYSFTNGWVLSPFARVSWVHEFRPDRQMSALFVTLPAAAFTVDGARAASDSARIDTGAKLTVQPGKSVFTSFTGEWSDRSQIYAASAGFRAAW